MWGLSQKEKNERLREALSERSPALVREALKRGANPNAQMLGGNYPLIWAVRQHGETALALATALLDGGADVNVCEDGDMSALSRAVADGSNTKLLEKLLDAGADVAAPASSFANAFEYALARRAWNIVNVFIDRGLTDQFFTPEKDSATLLMRLIEADAPEHILQKVIATQDVNAMAGGRTALFLAAQSGREMAVGLLLSQTGIDVNAGVGNKRNPLHAAITNNHSDIAMKLIACGADIFSAPEGGRSALCHAAVRGDIQVLRAVLKRANALGRAKELDMDAAFMLAAQSGRDLIIIALGRDDGADLNQTDAFGRTAAVIAATQGHTNVLKTLTRLGADMLKGDKEGVTPYEHATAKKHEEARAFLETVQPGYVPPPPPPPPVDMNRFVKSSNTSIDVREKGLSMTFNFWTQQLIYRDVDKGGVMVVQNFADVQRREAIVEAYDVLKRLGGTPPEPVFNRTPDKPALPLKIK